MRSSIYNNDKNVDRTIDESSKNSTFLKSILSFLVVLQRRLDVFFVFVRTSDVFDVSTFYKSDVHFWVVAQSALGGVKKATCREEPAAVVAYPKKEILKLNICVPVTSEF